MSDSGSVVAEAVMILDYVKSSGITAKFGNQIAAIRKEAMGTLVRTAAYHYHACFCKDTGDGFFITFSHEIDAVGCAIAILQHLSTLNTDLARSELEIRVRIGVTFGELIVNSFGDRKGSAANTCARFESLKAEDLLPDKNGIGVDEFAELTYNRTLISGHVYDGIKGRYPARFAGWIEPKDTHERHKVYIVDWESAPSIELPNFPPSSKSPSEVLVEQEDEQLQMHLEMNGQLLNAQPPTFEKDLTSSDINVFRIPKAFVGDPYQQTRIEHGDSSSDQSWTATGTRREKAHDVFICYASTDGISANGICAALEEVGIDCWMAPRNVPAGAILAQEITRAVRSSRVMVLVLSPATNGAQNVPRQVEIAVSASIPIVPVKVKFSEPNETLAYYIRIHQSLRAYPLNIQGYAPAIQEAVRRRLREPSAESTVAAPVATPSEQSGIWRVPSSINTFYGRADVLQEITDQLTEFGQTAIVGLAGMGKSQVALFYAHKSRPNYRTGYLISADSEHSLRAGLTAFTNDLSLVNDTPYRPAQPLAIARNWFEKNGGWLLILDNVEDPDLIRCYLPDLSRGHVIITSRDPAVWRWPRPIQISKMLPEEGVECLLRCAGIKNPTVSERESAIALNEALDGLPLALDQAGAYILEAQITLQQYLVRYREQAAYMMKQRHGGKEYPHSVYTALSLSLQHVERENAITVELLRYCAFLAPDAIPEELLYTIYLILCAQSGAPLKVDRRMYEELSQAAYKLSLVRRDPDLQTVSMHRLVQAVLRDTIPPDDLMSSPVRRLVANCYQRYFQNRLRKLANIVITKREYKKEDAEHDTFLMKAELSGAFLHAQLRQMHRNKPIEHWLIRFSTSWRGYIYTRSCYLLDLTRAFLMNDWFSEYSDRSSIGQKVASYATYVVDPDILVRNGFVSNRYTPHITKCVENVLGCDLSGRAIASRIYISPMRYSDRNGQLKQREVQVAFVVNYAVYSLAMDASWSDHAVIEYLDSKGLTLSDLRMASCKINVRMQNFDNMYVHLAAIRKDSGSDSISSMDETNNIGYMLLEAAEYGHAMRVLEELIGWCRALQPTKADYSRWSAVYAAGCANLTEALLGKNKVDEAIAFAESVQGEFLDKDVVQYCGFEDSLAHAYTLKGRYEQATVLFERVLAKLQKAIKPNISKTGITKHEQLEDKRLITVLSHYADLRENLGQHQQAAELRARANDIGTDSQRYRRRSKSASRSHPIE